MQPVIGLRFQDTFNTYWDPLVGKPLVADGSRCEMNDVRVAAPGVRVMQGQLA